jgi:hypothetical protein
MENRLIRKYFLQAALLLIAVLVMVKLYTYLTTAQVSISSPGQTDYVKIEGTLQKGKSSLVSTQAQQHLSARVRPGQYEASVSDQHGFGISLRIITVKARQKVSLTLSPTRPGYPEPVYGGDVAGLVADSSNLFFVDKLNSQISGASASSGQLFSLTNQRIVSAKWATTNLGIAQSDDSLYLINNGSVVSMSLPFNFDQQVVYDAARNGKTYIGDGGDLFAGDLGTNFKKIYSAGGNGIHSVAAATNKVAIAVGTRSPVADEGGAIDRSSGTSFVAVVNERGRAVKKSLFANNLSWSPTEKYLLVSGASGNIIYDDSLRQITNVPVNRAELMNWYSDDQLLYSVDSQLWIYSLTNHQAEKITALPAGDSITSIYRDQAGAYVYFAANNGEMAELYRIKVFGGPQKSPLTALSIFLPEALGSCNLNYLNFSQPTLLITFPNTASSDNCELVTQNELRNYNLDPSKFQYQLMELPQE